MFFCFKELCRFEGVAEKRVRWHFRKKMTEGACCVKAPFTAKAGPLPQKGRLKGNA